MQEATITSETLIRGYLYLLQKGYLKIDSDLLLKSKNAPIGEVHVWKDKKQHRKTANGWVEVATQRIKQPKGKENKFVTSFSSYDLKLMKEHPTFFRNSKVRRSFAKFKEHIQEHPEYLQHLGSLSKLEALAIYHYSLKWGVRPLNTDLEDKTFSQYTKEYEDTLSRALKKLHPYDTKGKPVYHGTTLRDHQIEDLKRKRANNESFKFGFFTSVGLRRRDGNKYMTKNRGEIKSDERLILFLIDSKTAKNVTKLRWRTDTHEAIIGHKAEYEVIDIQLKKGYTEIKLREL